MPLTTDPEDSRLDEVDPTTGLAKAYIVLTEEERAKGFVRPLRKTYVHRFTYDGSPVPGVITPIMAEDLGGCGAATTMATAIAETFASDPDYYYATYCSGCRTHLSVKEFHWDASPEAVGS